MYKFAMKELWAFGMIHRRFLKRKVVVSRATAVAVGSCPEDYLWQEEIPDMSPNSSRR
jgi:hypothetical protein